MKLTEKSIAKAMAQLAFALVPNIVDEKALEYALFTDDKFIQSFFGYCIAKGATITQLTEYFSNIKEEALVRVVEEAEVQLALLIKKDIVGEKLDA